MQHHGTLLALGNVGGTGNIRVLVEAGAHLLQVALVVKADNLEAVDELHIVLGIHHAVLIYGKAVVGHLDVAVLAQHRIALLGHQDSLLAHQKVAVSGVALATGSLHDKEALPAQGHVGMGGRLLEGSLLKVGVQLVGLHAQANLSDDGSHVSRTEGCLIHAIVPHAPH